MYDDELPGFGVRVYASGAKTWVVKYRTRAGRRSRLVTVGRVGVFTPDQARTRAGDLLRSVLDGADPIADRRGARAAVTVREFADEYIERHAKREKKSWREDRRRIDSQIVPALGHLALADVRRPDVARLHGRIGESHRYEANRVLALIAVLYRKAEEWGAVPEGHSNPARGIKPHAEKSRDRFVTPDELPRLLAAIDAEDSPHARGAFWLYLLTGLRKRELLTLRWEFVDLVRREIRLPDTKAGRPHVVALSTPAVEILNALPRLLGNPHVLPSPVKPGAPWVDMKAVWRRIRARAGLEDVRLHDLRRTVGSYLAMSGASLPLIGRVLNHSNASTTQVYARFAEDATRGALEAHAQRIMQAAHGG